MAVSWCGHESLIIPKLRRNAANQNINAAHKDHRMIRLYVGLDEPAYIVEDLERDLQSFNEKNSRLIYAVCNPAFLSTLSFIRFRNW
jgi:hypothetical protein